MNHIIAIQDADPGTARRAQGNVAGGGGTTSRAIEQPQAAIFSGMLCETLPRIVGRSVIDNEDLDVTKALTSRRPQGIVDEAADIATGDDDADDGLVGPGIVVDSDWVSRHLSVPSTGAAFALRAGRPAPAAYQSDRCRFAALPGRRSENATYRAP